MAYSSLESGRWEWPDLVIDLSDQYDDVRVGQEHVDRRRQQVADGVCFEIALDYVERVHSSSPMKDIFISHATDDREVATRLCGLLEARGFSCWIAPRNVEAGAEWDEAIVDAIHASHAFLLVLSAPANPTLAANSLP